MKLVLHFPFGKKAPYVKWEGPWASRDSSNEKGEALIIYNPFVNNDQLVDLIKRFHPLLSCKANTPKEGDWTWTAGFPFTTCWEHNVDFNRVIVELISMESFNPIK